MTFNEKTAKAVEVYAEAIVSAVKQYEYNSEVDVDYAEAYSADRSEESRSAMVTTPIGVVMVFPDFRKKGARACILKLGEMRRLEMEGFTEEFINDNGEIYGDLLPFTVSNAEVFAYYLTHKIDAATQIKS